jgi:hypothetical protein
MHDDLCTVVLKSGDRAEATVVRAPDDNWHERITNLLAHKDEIWRWQISHLLSDRTGSSVETRFYLLHRDGIPFSNVMTVEFAGVGLLGHVGHLQQDAPPCSECGTMRYHHDARRCLLQVQQLWHDERLRLRQLIGEAKQPVLASPRRKKFTEEEMARKVTDARADAKGNITHVKVEGNQRFTPVEQAINMADQGELSNAHAVHPKQGNSYLRTNPDNTTDDNLDTMAGDS